MSERLLQMMQMKPKCLRQYKNHFKISSQLSDSWLTFTPKKESCSGGSAFHCCLNFDQTIDWDGSYKNEKQTKDYKYNQKQTKETK